MEEVMEERKRHATKGLREPMMSEEELKPMVVEVSGEEEELVLDASERFRWYFTWKVLVVLFLLVVPLGLAFHILQEALVTPEPTTSPTRAPSISPTRAPTISPTADSGCFPGAKLETPIELTGTALVFRTHSLSDAQAKRICEYARRAADIGVDIWMSMDGEHRDVVLSDETKLKKFCTDLHYMVHFYNTETLLAYFPALPEVKSCAGSYQWSMHIEPVTLWYRYTKAAGMRYKYCWFFEQDVGVSGDFALFLSHFHNASDDLLAPPAVEVPSTWTNTLCHTKQYENVTGNMQKMAIKEMVVRMSTSYLDYLFEMSSSGVIGWSEESTITLCLAGKFSCGAIPSPFFDRYASNVRVSPAEWRNILVKCHNNLHKVGRLYHALKF